MLVAQVDLTRGRFKLADAKTEAGVREDPKWIGAEIGHTSPSFTF